jgi:hypothetical protein
MFMRERSRCPSVGLFSRLPVASPRTLAGTPADESCSMNLRIMERCPTAQDDQQSMRTESASRPGRVPHPRKWHKEGSFCAYEQRRIISVVRRLGSAWLHGDGALVRLFGAIPPPHQRLAGICLLLVGGWVAIYGNLWSFEGLDQHRFVAKAMLTGTLKLRNGVSLIQNDEQVFNGSAYTNWGYGVPLLEVPFVALATAVGALHGFFPDRAIYFSYYSATVVLLWAAFDLLVGRASPPQTPLAERRAVSWAATWLALCLALFPLMICRFIIYEETMAYFVLSQLAVVSAYIFALRSSSIHWPAVLGMGAAAGMGLLVRPTGVAYACMWALLISLEGRARKAFPFFVAIAPFVAFSLYSNWVRSGSYLGLGYPNSTPWWSYHVPMQRFGSRCSDSPVHALLAAARLFTGFFFLVRSQADDSWLEKCHFDFEARSPVPFFGPIVPCVMGWTFHKLLVRRELRVTRYAPYLLLASLFGMYVRRGMGFAWRYAGDFWPAILLACVHHVLGMAATRATGNESPSKVSAALMTRIMAWYGSITALCFFLPHPPVSEIIPANETATMLDRFRASRWERDAPLPSKLSCGNSFAQIYHNGLGWNNQCGVDTFTNVFLGIAPKQTDLYQIRARTQGMSAPTLRAYVNGKIYIARKVGDTYAADVTIPFAALGSPTVLVTFEWTRDFEPPAAAKLLSIELA